MKIPKVPGRGKMTVLTVAVALVLVAAPAALAANGGNFILGQKNVATAISKLVGKVAGPSLLINNVSEDPKATALQLNVKAGKPPMKVNSDTKVPKLNADKLDNLDQSAFLRSTGKAADSDKLDGKDSTEFYAAGSKVADSVHADNADNAANADKVDGFHADQIPGSIASIARFAGPSGNIAGGTNTYTFVGPTKTVTTSASQILVGSAQAPLALGSGGPQNFLYGLCYQPNAGGTINNFVGFGYSVGQLTTNRVSWAASASVTPGAGTWKVGYCVLNSGSGAISNTDYVNGWVQVVNGGITVSSAVSKGEGR